MEWNGMEWNGMEWNGMEWNGMEYGMEWNGMEWNGMEWNGMEWNGMEWNGMEWNGMEWNGMEWNGMEWNGMEWNGMEWNGMEWNGMEWNGMEWNGMEWNGMEWNGMEWNGMEWNGMEWNGMEWNGMEWNGMEWNGMEWNGMEWNGMEWNGMEWNGMEWNGMAILRAEQVTARYRVRTGPWVRRAKWFTLAATYVMNTWASYAAGSLSGVVLHSVPPLVVFVAAEAVTDLRDKLTEAVSAAFTEADRRTPATVHEPRPRASTRSKRAGSRTTFGEYLAAARAAWTPGTTVTPSWVREVTGCSRGLSPRLAATLTRELDRGEQS
ncbi:hypothetical protein [Saccharothrix sp. HUAS TT10]|uniref:hypothetical protein n=1 Tax=Saccharothrix sp. HUAS TT10 TaxID=3447450 RepID=UPI003F722BD6